MKTINLKPRIFLTFILLFSLTVTMAQVGINTTTPNTDAILDVTSTATKTGGLLMPRVALTGTGNTAPLSANVAGMTVYNTATAGDVTPGYYYNDGSQWVRIAADTPSNDWSLTGNAGTTAGTNFLGTTDNVNLRLRTSNANAFEISSGNSTNRGKLRAMTNGTEALPVYSFSNSTSTGMFRPANNQLGFSTNGTERVRIDENGNVGINNNNPSQRLQVNGNLRLEGAFMPGNAAGNTDQILLSKGAGNDPGWGPGFLNTGEIDNIGKYYTGLFDSDANTYLTLTITDPNMTVDTAISYNFTGNLPAGGPQYGNNIRLLAETRDGSVIFYITNLSFFDISNLEIVYVAYYN